MNTHSDNKMHVEKEATHIIFSKNPDNVNLYNKWIVKRRGPTQALLHIQNINEIPNTPENTKIAAYVKGLCKHGVVRFNKKILNSDVAIKQISDSISLKIKNSDSFNITQDKTRDNWFHIIFKDPNMGKQALGELLLENNVKINLERWVSKPKPELLDNYLNRLFNTNFKNDKHMQALALKHRGWIPLRSKEMSGLLEFKWVKNNRINSFDVRESINNIRGGRVHKKYKNLVNTSVVWRWYNNQVKKPNNKDSSQPMEE